MCPETICSEFHYSISFVIITGVTYFHTKCNNRRDIGAVLGTAAKAQVSNSAET